jgi:hypothetical protein
MTAIGCRAATAGATSRPVSGAGIVVGVGSGVGSGVGVGLATGGVVVDPGTADDEGDTIGEGDDPWPMTVGPGVDGAVASADAPSTIASAATAITPMIPPVVRFTVEGPPVNAGLGAGYKTIAERVLGRAMRVRAIGSTDDRSTRFGRSSPDKRLERRIEAAAVDEQVEIHRGIHDAKSHEADWLQACRREARRREVCRPQGS